MPTAGRRIAIVGAGASGLVAAWLLHERHDVTVFEASEIPGGNIRTLGGNVPCAELSEGVRLDAGVVEFDRIHFPRFHALMRELEVPLRDVPITSGLLLADGRAWHAPERLVHEYPNRLRRAWVRARHVPLLWARDRFLRRTADLSEVDLLPHRLADFLDDDTFGLWTRLLMTYAYSIPYARVGDVGAALTVPVLRRFYQNSAWTSVVGGASAYVERITRRLGARLRTSTPVARVDRDEHGPCVTSRDGPAERFDDVVLAVTPEQVLKLLVDADEAERRRFRDWRPNDAYTLVHRDMGLYARRGLRYASEFDLVQTPGGGYGYNAYLNRLCGVPPECGAHYGLALGIDDEIDPGKVVHRQPHRTPSYGVPELRLRPEIRETNGHRRTWFVGAWLGEGLHEGAVASAETVALALGGRAIGEAAQASRCGPSWTESPVSFS